MIVRHWMSIGRGWLHLQKPERTSQRHTNLLLFWEFEASNLLQWQNENCSVGNYVGDL